MKTNQTKPIGSSMFNVRGSVFHVPLNLLLMLVATGTGFGQPVITQQPQSCTNLAGTTASFTVEATGTEPLAYQWQKYSLHKPLVFSDLADCTNATLVLANVVSDDASNYRVVVTNIEGAVTSSVAHLYVILPATLQFTETSYLVSEAGGTVTLAVQRLNDATTAVSVDYATADGTATAGLKYTATSATLAFAAGETDKTLVVPILNEGFVEGVEYFQVILSNPTGGAVLGTSATASVYITDNDTGLQLEFANYSVAEDAGFVLLTVRRGDDGDFPVSVDYATTDGTAKNGLDYTGVTNTLFFASGEKVKTFTIPILSDGLVEGTEDFQVTLSNPTNSVLGSPAVATVSITDNPGTFIKSLAPYQTMSVYLGSNTSLAITAPGTPPLSFQWRLEGFDLPGMTDQALSVPAAQVADEGNYTVVVTNLSGSVTSAPARLYVTPPSSQMIRRDFTNAVNLRLPYWYLLPANYSPSRSYPLVCVLHGIPGGETRFQAYANLGPQALGLVFASYKQQEADPSIVVWPARRVEDETHNWTAQYLEEILGLLDQLVSEFNVDTNRLYMVGYSEGVHAVWDCLGSRPGFFAGAFLAAGWQGSTPPASVKDVPGWVWCAADDTGQVANTRSLVAALRLEGGSPIYTEYQTGGHYDGIIQGLCTPATVDWLLAQRRGAIPTNEPLLSIISPTQQSIHLTGATNLSIAGSAAALGRDVTQVTWRNYANYAKGFASGTDLWSATNIPLVANQANVVVVVGTTTSWAPALGGNTTFNDTLTVIQSPLQATLALQGSEALLKWSGGGPPYRVQRATDLAAGDWTDFLNNATPPVPLPLTGQAGFYRILGQ